MAFTASPAFVPRSGWGAWRKPRPQVTFERDSAPDEWAWEAVGLDRDERPCFNWLLMGLILLLTSCPAFALGLFVLLGG